MNVYLQNRRESKADPGYALSGEYRGGSMDTCQHSGQNICGSIKKGYANEI